MSTRLALRGLALWGLALWGCPQPPPPPVPNTPPNLTLTRPGDDQQVRVGQPVELSARVQDAEDGAALEERVVWVSSLSGQLARGASASGTFSEAGAQTLTATVTDSGGQVGSASVTLEVLAAGAPTATVRSPSARATFSRGELVELECEARTAGGAPLSGEAVQWTSALSGPLPSGASVRAPLTVAGEDTLTCTATDPAAGLSTSARVRLSVRAAHAPTLLLTHPAPDELFVKQGEPPPASPTLALRATAQDIQAPGGPGNLDAAIRWTLRPGDVPLGSGPALTHTLTTPGSYTLTASVVDALGARAEDSVRVHLVTNLPPRCALMRPREDGARVLLEAPTRLEGACVDPETGAVLAPTWTTSASATPLGTGTALDVVFSTPGTQRLSACAQDPLEDSLRGCAERSVRALANTAPRGCAILAPLEGATVPAGTPLPLEGTASDAEDAQPTLRYAWASSRDGALPLGARATTERLRTEGPHTLTLTVSDPWGLSCAATVTVRVNGAPQVQPPAATQGGTDCLAGPCVAGQDVAVSGAASDSPEGVASLQWLDGLLGAFGTTATATLSAPEAGKHTLVLRATDAAGAVGRAASTATVLPEGSATLATPLLDTGRPIVALALAEGEVWYADGQSPTAFRLDAPSADLALGSAARALLRLPGAPVLFVGTEGGLERCEAGTCTRFSGGPLALSGNRVEALAAHEASDVLLLGTDKGLVLTRASDPSSGGPPGTLSGQRVLDGVPVRQVVLSPTSSATQLKAWAATAEGLAELTLSTRPPFEPALAQVSVVLHGPPSIPDADVLSVAVSPEGRAYAGTRRGLSALDSEGPALRDAPWSLPDEEVRALLFERRGGRDVLWAGTRSGLVRYDATLDIATRFGAEDGLPGEDLRSLARAPDGTRYLGTARGLARYAGP